MALWSSGVGKYRHQGILGGRSWKAAAGGDFEAARYVNWYLTILGEPSANSMVWSIIFPSKLLPFGGCRQLSNTSKFANSQGCSGGDSSTRNSRFIPFKTAWC